MNSTRLRHRSRRAVAAPTITAALTIAAALAVTGPALGASAYPSVPTGPFCTSILTTPQVVVSGRTTLLATNCTSSARVVTITAANGTATIDRYGTIVYKSDSGYHGPDTLTVTAVILRDGGGPSASFEVAVG